jgi:nitronate monooxygenase
MALSHFPFPELAKEILDTYFVENGIRKGEQFKNVPAPSLEPSRSLIGLMAAASFCFVWLAKHNDDGSPHGFPISTNYLEKMQMPLIFSIFGAMLASVDCITIGAGIADQVPGILDRFALGQPSDYRVVVEGLVGGRIISFNPREFFGSDIPKLIRPAFLPIISSNLLAEVFCGRRQTGLVQGFVVEKDKAGGHNALPRGKPIILNELQEPVYGPRDEVDPIKLKKLGLPFWLGGAMASPEALKQAIADGANGIQVGTAFAFCEESGLVPGLRNQAKSLGFQKKLQTLVRLKVSPTGFPFNVAELEGTLSSAKVYDSRERVCDLCCLRVPYLRPGGEIGYRCKAEPTEQFVKKGGRLEDTEGACCLCNGLLSTCGFGGPNEPPIVTLGRNVEFLSRLMKHKDDSYSAGDVMNYLLGKQA